MNENLKNYIDSARSQGHTDEQIIKDMTTAGWSETVVRAGVEGKEPLVVPPPPPPAAVLPTPQSPSAPGQPQPGQPQAVVENMTTRGLEYTIMFIAMGVAALALGALLHSSINTLLGVEDFWYEDSVVSFASAALVVAFPIWGVLFLRLKKAEQNDPNLLRDPSRKRSIQLTMIVTFLIGIGNVIGFVFNLMSGGDADTSGAGASGIGGNFVHLLITLSIAGGIFAYYWHDQHKVQK